MILNRLLAALVIGGAAASAVAQSDGASGDAPVGKVNAVYVREARSLFIEKKLLRKVTGKELWVDVRAASQVVETAVGELFEVPADIAIERGDTRSEPRDIAGRQTRYLDGDGIRSQCEACAGFRHASPCVLRADPGCVRRRVHPLARATRAGIRASMH